MTERAAALVKRFDKLKGERSTFDSHWQEVAERVWPASATFITTPQQQGDKRTEKVFDATAERALNRFAAAMDSTLTPRTQRWHAIRVDDDDINDRSDVRRWCEECTAILFAHRYAPSANFASQMFEAWKMIGAFGTATLFTDDARAGRFLLRYQAIHTANVYVATDFTGMVDTTYRPFKLTARAAAQQFGKDKVTPKIKAALDAGKVDDQFDFVHCVMPANDVEYAEAQPIRWPWASFYLALDEKAVVAEGGYLANPYATGRFTTMPGESYGRGPAMEALPDIKTLNEMSKTTLRAAHKAVDPPLLAFEDGVLSAFSTRPNAINYGGVDSQGRQLVVPMQTGANLPLAFEMEEQRRRVINDSFLVTLFQILVEQPGMTATEAMLRAQEKGALLAPTMGRQQSEMLGPLISREFAILMAARRLPPPPRVLMQSGAQVRIEYVGPLARMQRADESVGFLRTMDQITPLATADPRILKRFNENEVLKGLSEINGVPQKWLRTDEEMAALAEQDRQAAEMANIVQAAPAITQSLKNAAQAQQIAGAQGQPLPAAA